MTLISKKTIAGLIIILILAVLIVPRFIRTEHSHLTYRTAAVDRNDVVSIITANGTVNPLTTVGVGSQLSGTVDKI
ncbi:MAG: efflux RND transporter periplasmic adaptor subunit, partial [Thermodesulfobacteriota bacterium]